MLLSSDWQAELGVPTDVVKGAVLVSGLYDLAPVQQTTPNDWLSLSAAEAVTLSPQHRLPAAATRMCVATVETDTDEFKCQSMAYADACRQQGCAVKCSDELGGNHFDVIMD